jgi:hypothetical protein
MSVRSLTLASAGHTSPHLAYASTALVSVKLRKHSARQPGTSRATEETAHEHRAWPHRHLFTFAAGRLVAGRQSTACLERCASDHALLRIATVLKGNVAASSRVTFTRGAARPDHRSASHMTSPQRTRQAS